MWYCELCGKEKIFNTKSKHNLSDTHLHRKQYGIIIKKYGFIEPEIDEVDNILRDVIEDCREKLNFFA